MSEEDIALYFCISFLEHPLQVDGMNILTLWNDTAAEVLSCSTSFQGWMEKAHT